MLSKTAQKRLDRIIEIQDAIQKLYSELEIALGIEITNEPMPKNIGEVKLVGRKWGDPCKECGSKRRHFKTCSQSPQKMPKLLKTVSPLTEDQYDDLRDAMYDKDFQSVPYALMNKMSPREVNLSVKATSYEDYLNKSKTV